ncbi:MAG: diguanylate cyclase [Acidimicrobiia bacterium]|nr:diguanylate cyclase [Acidimicrobiia bacterium]
MVCEDLEASDVDDLVERVRSAVEEPVSPAGTEVEVGVTIGAARAEESGTDPDELLRRADRAMYERKRW